MDVEVDSVNVGVDRYEGCAPGHSMNRCAITVAGAVLAGAFAGWNSYYLEELFSGLLLFALVALPLLGLAFSLAMVEAGAGRGMPWVKTRAGELAASLRSLAEASRQRLLLAPPRLFNPLPVADPDIRWSVGAPPAECPCVRTTRNE